MNKLLELKLIRNKCNNQYNVSLPKRKIKDMLGDNPEKFKRVRLLLDGFE